MTGTGASGARRVALLTGATSGTGRDLAVRLAAGGWDVALGWRSKEDRARSLVEECRALGASTFAGRLDVADEASARAFVEGAVAALGRIDALANVASYAAPGGAYRVPLESMDLGAVASAFDVDVVGALRMIRLCLPHLRATGAGAVVNYSSASALAYDPDLNTYVGAKVAIAAYTASLARELGPAVRINCIAPGAVRTDWMETWHMPADEEAALARAACVGRIGEPRDLTAMATFLLSPESSFVTGQVFTVDGGLFRP